MAFYVILALVLRKQATVYLGLCAEHFQRRRKLLAAGGVLLAIGLVSPTVAFAADYPGLGLLGGWCSSFQSSGCWW